MLTPSLIAMALFGLTQPSTVRTRFVHVSPWTVAVRADRFTGSTTCSAHMRGVHLEGPVATFELGRSVDASDALYRLDLGPARFVHALPVTEQVSAYIRPSDSLSNPSGGRVVLPLTSLAGVKRVDIRPEPTRSVATFDLSGLPAVLRAEAAAGCSPAAPATDPALVPAPGA